MCKYHPRLAEVVRYIALEIYIHLSIARHPLAGVDSRRCGWCDCVPTDGTVVVKAVDLMKRDPKFVLLVVDGMHGRIHQLDL